MEEPYICDYISYREATKSQTATRYGIDNTPTRQQIEAMRYVGKHCFDPMRKNFGIPVGVMSFFRCPKLNFKLGSDNNSFHPYGMAIDIDGDMFGSPSNKEIFDFILNNLPFTELIWEYGNRNEPAWVHVALCKGRENERQIKRAYLTPKKKKKIIKPFDLYKAA